MLVLDTNVISEALRPRPDERVGAWLKALPLVSVFTTAISQAEIL
jgi:predicted nucleic acid-binding protein